MNRIDPIVLKDPRRRRLWLLARVRGAPVGPAPRSLEFPWDLVVDAVREETPEANKLRRDVDSLLAAALADLPNAAGWTEARLQEVEGLVEVGRGIGLGDQSRKGLDAALQGIAPLIAFKPLWVHVRQPAGARAYAAILALLDDIDHLAPGEAAASIAAIDTHPDLVAVLADRLLRLDPGPAAEEALKRALQALVRSGDLLSAGLVLDARERHSQPVPSPETEVAVSFLIQAGLDQPGDEVAVRAVLEGRLPPGEARLAAMRVRYRGTPSRIPAPIMRPQWGTNRAVA